MRFSAIIALAVGFLSVEASNAHSHLHKRIHAREAKNVDKRGLVVANSLISTPNAMVNNDVVEGSVLSMPFQNTVVNNNTQDAVVLFWTNMNFAMIASPYNSNPPSPSLILDLPAGASKVVSFSDSFSGAYAAVFPDTGIQAGGGVQAAWVELTTSGITPVVDVSMLPDMASKWTSVETDHCISDYTSCSYQCNDGSASCWTAEVSELMNCAPSANTIYDAGPSGSGPWNGGCRLSPTFTTTFSG